MASRHRFVKTYQLLVLSLLLTLAATVVQPLEISAQTLVWSATFESGTDSNFNSTCEITSGAVSTVSSSLAHTGEYSGYYYWNGGTGTAPRRAYPTEQLSATLANYRLQVWVYVPSVNLIDWVSFITMHLSDGTFITIDSNSRQELHLFNQALPVDHRKIPQMNPIKWRYNKWFNITVIGNLRPSTNSSDIQVYQDGSKIIDFTGYVGNGLLWRIHFGLYIGPRQDTFAVYNDDIRLDNAAASFMSTTTTTTTAVPNSIPGFVISILVVGLASLFAVLILRRLKRRLQ